MPEIITREAAKAAGLTFFFSGKPCPHGHVAERYVGGNGMCRECNVARTAAWRNGPNGGAARKALRNVDFVPEKERAAAQHRARVQQADKLGYARPLPEAQSPPRPEDGRCECCGEDIGASLLVLDHDHDLGSFLGWICQGCNILGDNIARLQFRIEYLKARGFT